MGKASGNILFIFGLIFILASPSYAFQESPWTKEEIYNQKMFGKLKFGIANSTIGFLEIFQETYEAIKEDRMMWAGLAEGMFNGAADTVGGALHTATFFMTTLDIPLPEGGTDIA